MAAEAGRELAGLQRGPTHDGRRRGHRFGSLGHANRTAGLQHTHANAPTHATYEWHALPHDGGWPVNVHTLQALDHLSGLPVVWIHLCAAQ